MVTILLVFHLWGFGMNQLQNEPLKPGTFVMANDPENIEYGIVVSCWYEDEIKDFDCYVAFFGDKIPDGKPLLKPYILRYAVSSLAPIDPPSTLK